MEDKERTLTEAEADEPECKSEQKPEPTTEENSEQNAEPESKENSEDESELAIIAEEAPADITKDNCGIVSKDLEFYKDFNDLIELINQSDHIYDMDLINKAYRVALKDATGRLMAPLFGALFWYTLYFSPCFCCVYSRTAWYG